MGTDLATQPEIQAILDRGEDRGCLDLTDLNQLVQTLVLDEDEGETLQ